MFFYLALRVLPLCSTKFAICDFALNAPISCMNTAMKSAAGGAKLQPPICKAAAGFAPVWREFHVAPMRSNAPEKRTSFDDNCTANTRSRRTHWDAADVSIRCQKRSAGADERPAEANAKSPVTSYYWQNDYIRD